MGIGISYLMIPFQSTLSVRRATVCGRRPIFFFAFQSTLSVRRATLLYLLNMLILIFQSTLSVRRATISSMCFCFTSSISIHALREESDQDRGGFAPHHLKISIHALREESDSYQYKCKSKFNNFNPRSP